jgi:oligopeptide/dipeptide ABC transporter ATP-binding protein
LVGESGSGKSTLTRLLARLESPTPGELRLDGDLLPRRVPGSLRRYSRNVQLVLQDPYASLNPVHKVSYILGRSIKLHATQDRDRRSVEAQTIALLEKVQLAPGKEFLSKYPHELSGGQRQRVAIARTLAAHPRVLLADEPVSMLDVSIRLGLLTLLTELKDSENLALLYVTHDISTARYFSDRIVVLYAGQAVESGSPDDIILNPQHPYTRMLVAAAPDPTAPRVASAPTGEPPTMSDPPSGCRFHPRCPHVMPRCTTNEPPEFLLSSGGMSKCWLHDRPEAGVAEH